MEVDLLEVSGGVLPWKSESRLRRWNEVEVVTEVEVEVAFRQTADT